MCFDISRYYQNELIAEEDIICYKVMIKYPDYYESPYQGMHVTLSDEPYTAFHDGLLGSPLVPLTKLRVTEAHPWPFILEGLHSFIHKPDLVEFDLHFIGDEHNFVVIECSIPKGTSYYKNSSEYVSLKLKYNKEV